MSIRRADASGGALENREQLVECDDPSVFGEDVRRLQLGDERVEVDA